MIKNTRFNPYALFYCLSCALLLSCPLTAQDFNLDIYTIRQGLSFNDCNDILKDRQGFIWIATKAGLNRFDGRDFRKFLYNPADSLSPSGDRGGSLYEDKKGYIWYYEESGGLNRYNPRTETFKRFYQSTSTVDSLTSCTGSHFAEDALGNLWMISGNGLCRYDPAAEKFKIFYWAKKKTKPLLPPLNNLFFDSKNRLWLATSEGLFLLDFENENVRSYKGKSLMGITAIKEDKKGNLWLGTWGYGLIRFKPADGESKNFYADAAEPGNTSYNIFASIELEKNEEQTIVWAVGTGHRLFEFDIETETLTAHDLTQQVAGKGYLFMKSIYIDDQKNKWIASQSGFIHIDPLMQLFSTAKLPQRKPPQWFTGCTVIYQDPQDISGNTLWVAVWGQGIAKYNSKQRLTTWLPAFNKFNSDFLITEILRGNNHELWMATEDGLLLYDESNNSVTIYKPNRISNGTFPNLISALAFDARHRLWAGSHNGLFLFDEQQKKFIRQAIDSSKAPHGIAISENINSIIPDQENNFVIARGYSGKQICISKLDPETGKEEYYVPGTKSPISLPSTNDFFFVTIDSAGNYWASITQGIVFFNPSKNKSAYHLVTNYDGLHCSHVGALAEMKASMWIISDNGMYVLDKKTFELKKRYGVESGLAADDMDMLTRGFDGRLFTAKAFTIQTIDPQSIAINQHAPGVFITGLKVLNKEYLADGKLPWLADHLQFSYRQNQLQFSFAALAYTFKESNSFAYRLQGFEDEWHYTKENTVTYNNLDGGNYTFIVKAANNDGVWNEKGVAINFSVDPPWWKAWWFIALCITAMLLLSLVFHHIRVRQLKKMLAVRNHISSDLHDDIGSALSGISIYSELAKAKTGVQNPELYRILSSISENTKITQQNMQDIIWSINPYNDPFEKIITRMKIFAAEILEPKNIDIHFKTDESLIYLELTADKRKNFFLIFKEAVNNCAKYAACKNVTVELYKKQNKIILSVQDNGKGFYIPAAKNGNGLKTMQIRAKEMNGTLSVQSAAGEGTTVELSFLYPKR
ncbi:MAG TPA: two-component regulator propeller domain-containing protein [Panacibacter sp.]|nr:two-component regulator propeller domain-containing protein [Panacibacter sp.]